MRRAAVTAHKTLRNKRGQDQQRHTDQSDDSPAPIDAHRDTKQHDDRDQITPRTRNDCVPDLGYGGDIADHTLHQRARGIQLVKAHIKAHQMAQKIAAHVRLRLLRDPR